MEHISIDLETLGTAPDSAFISIGATFFDPKTRKLGSSFQVDVDFADAVEKRKVSGDTIKWWLQQSDIARENVLKGMIPVTTSLNWFSNFISDHVALEDVIVWGNGATFDISILEDAYMQSGIDIPWDFRNIRDVRTIVALCPDVKKLPFEGERHMSLTDAKHQAKMVCSVYEEKGL